MACGPQGAVDPAGEGEGAGWADEATVDPEACEAAVDSAGVEGWAGGAGFGEGAVNPACGTAVGPAYGGGAG